MNSKDVEELKRWGQGGILQPSELKQLFELVVEDPEDERVAEALENGVASADCVSTLVTLLNSTRGDQAYWASTFIGRLGSNANTAQTAVVDLICNDKQPAATRQRAVWALQQIGPLSEQAYSRLQKLECDSDVRMKRLLDQVLKQAV